MSNHKTPFWAMVIVLISTLLTSTAQLLWKLATKNLQLDISLFTNYYLIGGFALYLVAAIILIKALKYGELSILYPLIALSYVWVAILSWQYLGESLSALKIIGVLIIVLGVTLIGIGSGEKWQQASSQ